MIDTRVCTFGFLIDHLAFERWARCARPQSQHNRTSRISQFRMTRNYLLFNDAIVWCLCFVVVNRSSWHRKRRRVYDGKSDRKLHFLLNASKWAPNTYRKCQHSNIWLHTKPLTHINSSSAFYPSLSPTSPSLALAKVAFARRHKHYSIRFFSVLFSSFRLFLVSKKWMPAGTGPTNENWSKISIYFWALSHRKRIFVDGLRERAVESSFEFVRQAHIITYLLYYYYVPVARIVSTETWHARSTRTASTHTHTDSSVYTHISNFVLILFSCTVCWFWTHIYLCSNRWVKNGSVGRSLFLLSLTAWLQSIHQSSFVLCVGCSTTLYKTIELEEHTIGYCR